MLVGCEQFTWIQPKSSGNDRVQVARVFDQVLFIDEMNGAVPPGITGLDSVRMAESFVRNWVTKQLMVKEAMASISLDMAEIDRKVQDYRYALISHEFQMKWVNDKLNEEVSDDEIQAYYEEHQANFELKQNIIKGRYLKVPKDAPRQNQLEAWMIRNFEQASDDLKSYCIQFATAYHIDDETWVNFDQMIADTPFIQIPGRVQFLQEGGYRTAEDEQFNYYLYIAEHRITDEISPLEFVKENIKSIIVTQRRIELAETLERDIYEKARRNGDFEIVKP
jgi:hypothetical protein